MPVYEYCCDACGKRFEISQSMHDAPLDTCIECRGKVRRILSGGSGFIIKGAGSEVPVRTHCGKSEMCCGSRTPCDTPHCG